MDGTKSEATLMSKDGVPLDADVVKAIHLSLQCLFVREEHAALHLEPGSIEEREARTALAWPLRQHLAWTAGAPALGTICRPLAHFFDAQSGKTRELTLRHRHRERDVRRALRDR
jgi:hypothetical protein